MKIGREIGHEMNLLDIGGGFPSDKISESVLSALSLTKNDQLNYRVIAEPGRHFSTSACLLAFRVILLIKIIFR
jgi:diaminopimelate decarboxylase